VSLIIDPSKELEAALKMQARAEGLDTPEYARRLLERALGIDESSAQSNDLHSQTGPDKAQSFERWAAGHPKRPPLPDSAFQRENMIRDAE